MRDLAAATPGRNRGCGRAVARPSRCSTSTLDGFRSPWMMPRACAWASAPQDLIDDRPDQREVDPRRAPDRAARRPCTSSIARNGEPSRKLAEVVGAHDARVVQGRERARLLVEPHHVFVREVARRRDHALERDQLPVGLVAAAIDDAHAAFAEHAQDLVAVGDDVAGQHGCAGRRRPGGRASSTAAADGMLGGALSASSSSAPRSERARGRRPRRAGSVPRGLVARSASSCRSPPLLATRLSATALPAIARASALRPRLRRRCAPRSGYPLCWPRPSHRRECSICLGRGRRGAAVTAAAAAQSQPAFTLRIRNYFQILEVSSGARSTAAVPCSAPCQAPTKLSDPPPSPTSTPRSPASSRKRRRGDRQAPAHPERELRLARRARGDRLGPHQQVLRGLRGQALLRGPAGHRPGRGAGRARA